MAGKPWRLPFNCPSGFFTDWQPPTVGATCRTPFSNGFAGKNAHQTLGVLLPHRMEEAGLATLGFLAVDHALLLTSLHPATEIADLFQLQHMDPALGNWLANTSLYYRSFRAVAIIAGLVHRNHMGNRKTGKQTAFSSDILYDTLRKHEPNHLLSRAHLRLGASATKSPSSDVAGCAQKQTSRCQALIRTNGVHAFHGSRRTG